MKQLSLLAALLAAGFVGCADDASTHADGPSVTEVSESRLVVGQTFSVYGDNFLASDEGENRIHLRGQYKNDDGTTNDVDFTLAPIYDGPVTLKDGSQHEALRVNRFGPFANPFSQRPGTFTGKMSVIAHPKDSAEETEGEASDVTIEVAPSLHIDLLEPIQANCGAPALRALAGVPYRLQVTPSGIAAVKFEYTFTNVNGVDVYPYMPPAYESPVASDLVGPPRQPQDGVIYQMIVFNDVPDDTQSYVSVIRAKAIDAEGNSVETALPITVHRPLEVRYSGELELAEYYEPVPVSGCIPGSVDSRVTYSESKTESRQKSVSLTVSSNASNSSSESDRTSWYNGVSEGESNSTSASSSLSESNSTSDTYGVSYNSSESNSVGLSSSNGESWSWNMSQGQSESEYTDSNEKLYGDVSGKVRTSVKGEGSIPGLASVSGSVSVGVGVSTGGSTSDTHGVSHAESSEQGYSVGGSSSTGESFGSTTTDSRSQSLSGAYTLSGSHSNSESNTAARSASRTWDLTDSVSDANTISEGLSQSESQTWSTTTSNSVLMSYAAYLPRNQAGVFYRQTIRWVRRAPVISYDLCGVANPVGELQFNEWTWAPDFAVTSKVECEEALPLPKLPAAQCLIPPCGG